MSILDGFGMVGDYGGKGDTNQAKGAYGAAGADYGTIGSYGDSQLGYGRQDYAPYRQQMLKLSQDLAKDPTQQQKAQALGAQNADTWTIYAKARANLMNDAASRGLDTAGDSGTQSSVLGGGLASIGTAYADTTAKNATDYYNAYESPDAKSQRLARSAGILGDLSRSENTAGIGALDTAAKGRTDVAGGWLNLADMAGKRQQTDQQMWNGILTGVGKGIGGYLGGL